MAGFGLLAAVILAPATRAEDPSCDTDFVAPHAALRLEVLSSIRHPVSTSLPQTCKKFSAASVAYDKESRRLFIANPFDARLEIYAIDDPAAPALLKTVPLGFYSGRCDASLLHCSRPNHVAVADGVVAVVVVNDPATEPGRLVLMDTDGTILHDLAAGPSPTWVAFTPDRTRIVVANQGVASGDYRIDPEGSLAIVTDWATAAGPTVTPVSLQSFNARKAELIDRGVRVYGPCVASTGPCEVTVAQDLEPVALTIAADSSRAWITFEANNAIGVLDIREARVVDIRSLGLKDHGRWLNRLDATVDQDFDLLPWPVKGMYQANGIDRFRSFGRTYLITANRGNWRESSAFEGGTERLTVAEACANGRLPAPLCYSKVINGVQGLAAGVPTLSIAGHPLRFNADPAAPLAQPQTFGGRSFAIWTTDGRLVHDSGAALEAITHRACPAFFNSQSDQNTFDDRSDEKGPEPEGVVTAGIGGRTFAFVTLRRIGGVMVFDVSLPWLPIFQQYINNRDFSINPKSLPAGFPSEYFVNCAAGDLQSVKPVFVAAADAPGGKPLLLVVNNYSGSVTLLRAQ
jgi:hypothetical protein